MKNQSCLNKPSDVLRDCHANSCYGFVTYDVSTTPCYESQCENISLVKTNKTKSNTIHRCP